MSVTFYLANRTPEAIEWIDSDFEVNLSNVNAHDILHRLDLADPDGELMGVADDPADFMARAMLAMVGTDDSGFPAAQDGNMVDCGRRPGYLADVFDHLASLAAAAVNRGLIISWC